AGPFMRMTILNVGYPLARVADSTAGGAEQVLLTLDKALVRAGHKSIVLAPSGSKCSGLLVPVNIPLGNLDEQTRRESKRLFKRELQRILARYSVDLVHMHGVDFSEYLPEEGVPVVVTLHLPLSWYSEKSLTPQRATRLVCVSRSQARNAPPGSAM